jgi:hypothetical protein
MNTTGCIYMIKDQALIVKVEIHADLQFLIQLWYRLMKNVRRVKNLKSPRSSLPCLSKLINIVHV